MSSHSWPGPVATSAAVGSLLRSYDENGAWRMAHDCLRDAAEQRASHATASVTADHYDIGRPLLRCIDDCRRGLADLYKLQCGCLQREPFAKPGKQSLALLLGKSDQLIGCDPALGCGGKRGVYGVDECHVGSKGLRKHATDFSRMRRDRFTVYCNKNLAEIHVVSPFSNMRCRIACQNP